MASNSAGSFSHVEKAAAYARGVLDGRIAACKWTRLACKRHFDDLDKSEWIFDAAKAEKVCRFISLMPHTKGKWAAPKSGDPKDVLVKLEHWQCFLLCQIFGWVGEEGLRRFRKASIYVPRKNGKSLLAAGIGLYMLCADGEPGAEVYCGATTEKQAWEVFGPAKLMAQRTPGLVKASGVEVNARNINVRRTSSKFEPIIGDPGDGASPHLAIVDEYHEHATDRMYNTMITGMGARTQPLLLVVTTAGENTSSPCFDDFETCKKVLDGSLAHDDHFALIYTTDDDDNWASDTALIKANPNFDVSVSGDFLKARLAEAQSNARHQGRYKTKHLNHWVTALDAFFNVESWRKSAVTGMELEDFYGERIFIGMDLASKVDLAAISVLIPPCGATKQKWAYFGRYYLPEDTVDAPENEHYRKWRDEGWLTVTDGAIIDFDRIKGDIIDLCLSFECASLPYDPYQATKLVVELQAEGLPVIELRPTVLNFSDPMKMLDGLIREGLVIHNGDPVMTWMIGNVVARLDAKDNVYPRKQRERDKIDGPVALIMAMARAIVGEVAAPEPSAMWLT